MGQVVGVGEAMVGIQRPHVKHLCNLLIAKVSSSSKCPCFNEWQHHHQNLAPKYDVKLKRRMFFPSWENRLACGGWARSSTSSSRSSILHLYDLACGPLESNLWACSPMEAQARLVDPWHATVHQVGPANTNEHALQGSQVITS